MSCFRPLAAWRSKYLLSSSGKPLIHFGSPRDLKSFNSPVSTDFYEELLLPCGQCIGCRIDYSRTWAIRCLHESKLHDENSFLTLTYDDDHLPSDLSLDKTHFQKFMKRLRSRFPDRVIRYYHCGES